MDCSVLLKNVGERVRALRKMQGLSQEMLAELSGLHPVFVSRVETGKVKGSLCTYQAIADALDVRLADLVDLPTEMEPWDNDLLALFQAAKKLNKDKQTVFIQTVKGVLSGLGGL